MLAIEVLSVIFMVLEKRRLRAMVFKEDAYLKVGPKHFDQTMVTSDATLNGPSEDRKRHLESLISILTYAGEKDVPKT